MKFQFDTEDIRKVVGEQQLKGTTGKRERHVEQNNWEMFKLCNTSRRMNE